MKVTIRTMELRPMASPINEVLGNEKAAAERASELRSQGTMAVYYATRMGYRVSAQLEQYPWDRTEEWDEVSARDLNFLAQDRDAIWAYSPGRFQWCRNGHEDEMREIIEKG